MPEEFNSTRCASSRLNGNFVRSLTWVPTYNRDWNAVYDFLFGERVINHTVVERLKEEQ